LASFGFNGTTVDANNIGGLANAGYRFNWSAAYLEPVATLGYVQTHIDGFNALGTSGTTVAFNNGESFRGAVGARVGTTMWSSPAYRVDGSITGKVWDEFTSRTGVVLNTTGGALTLDDPRGRSYGEVAGLLNVGNVADNWSGFVDTSVKFNNEFTTLTAKGGVRKQW
jgi:outer membrane autotransporter protein